MARLPKLVQQLTHKVFKLKGLRRRIKYNIIAPGGGLGKSRKAI